MPADPTAIVLVVNRAPIPFRATYAARCYEWAPHGRMHLTRDVAEHCVKRAVYRHDPLSQRDLVLLAIEGEGDTTPIPQATIDERGLDYVDRTHLPPTLFKDDGTPIPQSAARAIPVNATAPDPSVLASERASRTRDEAIRAAARAEGLDAPLAAAELPLPPS